jgi:hypothetical protein
MNTENQDANEVNQAKKRNQQAMARKTARSPETGIELNVSPVLQVNR